MRRAIRSTHNTLFTNKFARINGSIRYAPACDDIYDFLGSYSSDGKKESLNLDNTAWANTVVAAGSMVAIVVFTGK